MTLKMTKSARTLEHPPIQEMGEREHDLLIDLRRWHDTLPPAASDFWLCDDDNEEEDFHRIILSFIVGKRKSEKNILI